MSGEWWNRSQRGFIGPIAAPANERPQDGDVVRHCVTKRAYHTA